MQRQIFDESPGVDNCSNLLAAGYTKSKDIASQTVFITDHQMFFSRSSVAFTPLQYCLGDSNGNVTGRGVDANATLALMDFLRASTADGGLAGKGVLSNTSIRTPYQEAEGYPEMYEHIRELGGPITYQTAKPSRVGNLRTTIQLGYSDGANAIELPKPILQPQGWVYCATIEPEDGSRVCSEAPLTLGEIVAFSEQLETNPYIQ